MSANAKHTPGPWRRGNAYGCGDDMAICSGPQVIARVVGFGYPVGDGFHPESDANARLIAAAPDGYELAVELIRGGGTSDSIQRAIDMARAILAKVER